MKNARTKKSRNRNERDASASPAVRQGVRAGRESGSHEPARANAGRGISASAFGGGRDAGLSSELERESRRAVAPDRERGADSGSGGDSGSSDGGSGAGRGRGRGRKRRAVSDAGRGNESGNHTDSHADPAEGADAIPEDVVWEVAEEDKPLKNRPGKRGRKAKGSMKGAMVMVLGQASYMLFTCVAMLTDHEHWMLQEAESSKLGKALDAALSTLPERVYEKVIEIADKWHPWIQLVVVLAIIVWPRIEESSKIARGEQSAEGADTRQSEARAGGSNGAGQNGAARNYRPYHSSLGYDN